VKRLIHLVRYKFDANYRAASDEMWRKMYPIIMQAASEALFKSISTNNSILKSLKEQSGDYPISENVTDVIYIKKPARYIARDDTKH